jgi:uncharacterized phage infection (PIP) family protein YhgE
MATSFVGVLYAYNEQIVGILGEVKNEMANLNETVAALRAAVADLATRVADQPAAVNEALATARAELEADRAKYAELVAAEDAEDIEQNSKLDAALDEADTAAAEIQAAVDQLNEVAATPKADDEAPAEEAPVLDVPAPAVDTPTDTTPPVEGEAPAVADESDPTQAPAAPADVTELADALPDNGLTADDAPVEEAAEADPLRQV